MSVPQESDGRASTAVPSAEVKQETGPRNLERSTKQPMLQRPRWI